MNRTGKKAWLGLGGNIGDVLEAVVTALKGLEKSSQVDIEQVSSIYKTPPWGLEDQPWYLNCCVELKTTLAPEELLALCQQAEREGKRERIVRWGPRTIDIDIIAYEDFESSDPKLEIPHPRATQRAFVMVPLAEIAAGLMLEGRSAEDWAKSLDGEGIERGQLPRDWWPV